MMRVQGNIKEFLAASKTALSQLSSYEIICVVLGNPTCDLDSTACTLAQGLFEYFGARDAKERSVAIIPVLNIAQKDFRLKTEVVYYLEFLDIPIDLLTFRDQIDLHGIQKSRRDKLNIILVDHHTLSKNDIELKPSVISIFDHRPKSLNWQWSCLSKIDLVGSCSTLIAHNILQKDHKIMDSQLAALLLGAILIDTCNLSEQFALVKEIDIDIVTTLEHFCPSIDRKTLFFEIANAKTDTSRLTLEEILHKDLKLVSDVPFAGIHSLVEDFLVPNNAIQEIEKFAINMNSNVVILLGLESKFDCVMRDIAVYTRLSDPLGDELTLALLSSEEPYLNLKHIKTCQGENYNINLYKIDTNRITRKNITPIVEKTVSQYISKHIDEID